MSEDGVFSLVKFSKKGRAINEFARNGTKVTKINI